MPLTHYPIYPHGASIPHKTFGVEPYIHEGVRLLDSYLGAYTEIGTNSLLIETRFDDYSYLAGHNDLIYTTVGKFCSIASHVRINPGNHPMHRVTQHHMTYRRSHYGFGEDDKDFFQWRRDHHCTIGHDVWIGHGAIIMPGITIGTGAVIGSSAVVTKNVEPYMIVGGVPAKPIRPRFDDATASALLKIAWWEWDHETLKARFDDLLDVPGFIAKYG